MNSLILKLKNYFFKEHGKNFFIYLSISFFVTSIDYSLLFILTHFFGIFYLISSTISYCLGLTLSYFFNRFFNFKKNTYDSFTKQYGLFVFFALMGLFFTNIILYILVHFFSLHYLLAKIFSICLVFFWNYLGSRYVVFR